MYTSTKSATIDCAGTLMGYPISSTATETSLISQKDADEKATRRARAQAFLSLECVFPLPFPQVTWYRNNAKVDSIATVPPYAPATFYGNVEANEVYSLVSVLQADLAAESLATQRALAARAAGQQILYQSAQAVAFVECGASLSGEFTATVLAGAHQSLVSQAAANALAEAEALATALAELECVPAFLSAPQSYTATCSVDDSGIGAPVTASNSHGAFTSIVSQGAADALSLADVTARAIAGLDCSPGFYNELQTYTAECSDRGYGWYGTPQVANIAAGRYYATTLAEANAMAATEAFNEANANISCYWNGSGTPTDGQSY